MPVMNTEWLPASMMGDEPNWWRPGKLPGVKLMDAGYDDNWGIVNGWRWYYSESTGRVYMFCYRAMPEEKIVSHSHAK
jgi:hypothetical protein